jgi:hypothetical protein
MNSFLQGKKILNAASLNRPATAVLPHVPSACRPPGAPAAAAGSAVPHVEVVKEGDKVVRLIVTCGCGERVEVECLYPAGS